MLPSNRTPMPVTTWLALLVAYCQPPDLSASLESVALLEDALAADYRPWVFCEASARAVERFERRRAIPSLSEIEKPLAGWIERSRDVLPASDLRIAMPRVRPAQRIGS